MNRMAFELFSLSIFVGVCVHSVHVHSVRHSTLLNFTSIKTICAFLLFYSGFWIELIDNFSILFSRLFVSLSRFFTDAPIRSTFKWVSFTCEMWHHFKQWNWEMNTNCYFANRWINETISLKVVIRRISLRPQMQPIPSTLDDEKQNWQENHTLWISHSLENPKYIITMYVKHAFIAHCLNNEIRDNVGTRHRKLIATHIIITLKWK